MLKKRVMCLCLAATFIAVLGLNGITFADKLEPSAPPAPTMKTLDEIPPTWSQILPADDGDSVGCGSSRFDCVLGGAAVLDKETGLVWEQSPDTTTRTWLDAISSHCYTNEVGDRKGWRLPTVEELASLVDTAQSSPSLPSGHPFSNVQSSWYWSATTNAGNTTVAWVVHFSGGSVGGGFKTSNGSVWCVRGGQGHDAY